MMTKPVSSTAQLRALAESRDRNKELYDQTKINPELLEVFDAPRPGMVVRISAPEFTCLCPLTGQPDFGEIQITYGPRDRCLESKSLKLYLGSFRHEGMFHEEVTSRICDHLVEVLEPLFIKVTGNFKPRGGIAFVPTSQWFHKESAPEEGVQG